MDIDRIAAAIAGVVDVFVEAGGKTYFAGGGTDKSNRKSMSAGYQPILWNRQKKVYDGILASFVVIYIGGFVILNKTLFPQYNDATLIIRAFGTLTFFLLHVILSIGPLSRIDRRFLPMLYNRRHLGVTMFLCASVHAVYSIIWFHAYGNIHPLLSLFVSNTHYGSFIFFPFQTLGFAAYIIIMLMAFTSHDFWLNTLSPRTWKSLHMLVYVAYGLVVMHVALGVIQLETSPVLYSCLMAGLIWLCAIHILAARKELKVDQTIGDVEDGFIYAGKINDVPEKRALVVNVGKERAAIFRYDGKLSAVSNVCKHQNGPLGEGKVVDGCITCPWHGYQYLPHNGCSPPPFTEKVSTYKLKLNGIEIFIHPEPLPEGTPVEPISIPSQTGAQTNEDGFYIGWQPNVDTLFLKHLKRTVPVVIAAGLLLLVTISFQQKHIANASFDTRGMVDFKGQLRLKPFPMLRAVNGKDANGNPLVKSYPLVNAGKFGADSLITNLLGEKDFVWASMKADPMVREGIAGLTLREEPEALKLLDRVEGIEPVREIDLGNVTVIGEIIDPKCYLGTMNPGEGKPHRACAIRCISGGIMPMFAFTDRMGNKQFAVIRGENGESVNQKVLFAVAEPVSISGMLKQFDNWLVLYANPETITRLYYN